MLESWRKNLRNRFVSPKVDGNCAAPCQHFQLIKSHGCSPLYIVAGQVYLKRQWDGLGPHDVGYCLTAASILVSKVQLFTPVSLVAEWVNGSACLSLFVMSMGSNPIVFRTFLF